MVRVKKYIIVGGPLDGQYANLKDFHEAYYSEHYAQVAGQFEAYRDEYVSFNAGDRRPLVKTSMVFLHVSLLTAPVREQQ